jgi:hypothetical protein
MFKFNRFTLVSLLLIGAYLLSACGGTLPQAPAAEVAPKVLAKEVVFTGTVEAMNGNQWVVSGQTITVDPAAALDPNITVGVIVKVEGTVSADGAVVALKIETSTVSDDNANDDNSNDVGNSNDDNSNGNVNSNDDNGNDDNSNDAGEVFGVVEALTADSITIDGVTYQFASFTEFKDAIAVGDQVKIHVIVNADGTFTIREIERSDDQDGNANDDNSNTNVNSNDDDGNDDHSNDNVNSNDDKGDDDNSNGDDDKGNDNGDD